MEIIATSHATSFIESFHRLITKKKLESILKKYRSGRGAPANLAGSEVIMGLVYHFFSGAGTFAAHMHRLVEKKMSDSALTQRRKNLPFEIFNQVMKHALRPLAMEQEHPDCFYKGLRLVSVDGTQFSAPNTKDILERFKKSESRREEAAFAKIGVSVLLEIGTHHPIGAVIATDQEGEITLTRRLLNLLPKKSLLIADRLLGVGALVEEVMAACQSESYFLIRARDNVKRKVIQVFADGSSLVEINLRDKEMPKKMRGSLLVREIKGRVRRSHEDWSDITVWTNLHDTKLYTALEILRLYGKRWEQELYYKQLKIDLHGGELLQSGTAETALQEIAALILASAIIAQERLLLGASQDLSSIRISFAKVREHLDVIWFAIKSTTGIVSEEQQEAIVANILRIIRREVIIPPRRSRSCARALRQPTKKWKRLFNPISNYSPLQLEIISAS